MELLDNTTKKMCVSSTEEDMINEYVENIKIQAEELVLVKFPKMALKIEELLKAITFNISDENPVHDSEADLRNRHIDEFISKMTQKFTVSPGSLVSLSDHQCNKNATCENFNMSSTLTVAKCTEMHVSDPNSRNPKIDECSCKSKELSVPSDSGPILNLTDHVRSCVLDSDNSAHIEHQIPSLDPSSLKWNTKNGSKEQKLDSDLLLSLKDRLRFKKEIVDMIQLMKTVTYQFLEDIQFLKMWMEFLTPRKEDTDSVIESILKDILTKVEKVETNANAFSHRISIYFYFRSMMIKRYVKYPEVKDFEKALQEFDEEYYFNIRYSLCEFRNFYATLYDMISKNIKDLKKTRAFNPNVMY